jgi:ATP-dependent DNA helicase RecQ
MECGSAMVVRTNRKTGNRFWGCSTFPKCKATKLISSPSGLKRSVRWSDGLDRGDYHQLFLSVGARPSFVTSEGLTQPDDEISKSLFLIRDRKRKPNDLAAVVSHSIQKVLHRGELPFCTLLVEQAIFKHLDLSSFVEPLVSSSAEIGFTTEQTLSDTTINAWPLASSKGLTSEELEYPKGAFDSPRERSFLMEWVPEHLGQSAQRWFSPQVPLDMLMRHYGSSIETGRRADFLLALPGCKPLVIELDGDDHKEKVEQDKARDKELDQIGIDVIRVPNAEVDAGKGPALDRIVNHFENRLTLPPELNEEALLAEAVDLACDAARLQTSVMMALERGLLDLDDDWNVFVASDKLPKPIIRAALADLSALVNAYLDLFDTSANRPKLKIVSDSSKASVSVSLKTDQTHSTIFAHLGSHDVVVCRAPLPVSFAGNLSPPKHRPRLQVDDKKAKKPLTVFLQTLFRKQSFRELQSEAICNVLRGNDTVTLLPTGAGKSIIYQLAGMLLPGITIVIDPIVALIEDQELGLKNNGISRVAGLRTNQGDSEELKRLQLGMSQGDYLYVLMSPERLLVPSFREALASMMKRTCVSLAVIDEAHCVSQWGHSFRFPYLQLASNLRNHCSSAEAGSPTILALTGTASRTVLKELVAEVGISPDDPDSIIRPSKFDRPELTFSIKRIERGGDAFPELAASLEELPGFFDTRGDGFYDPNGKQTNSGIVFAPFVRGQTHGLLKIRDEVAKRVPNTPGIFGGRTPSEDYTNSEWEAEKRQHAEAFKDNSNPLLVATNAFGMGIDKSNIRWTLHMGLPSSIEAFYQEAGRAGRDKKQSHCLLLFSEVDPKATDEVLEADSLEELEKLAKKINNNNDDISRALFFHLQSFSSKDDERRVLERILPLVSGGNKAASASLNYGSDRDGKPILNPSVTSKNKARIERALIRMSQAGLLEDYSADYGGKTFNLRTRDFSLEQCTSHILSYVKKVQPSQTKKSRSILEMVELMDGDQQPLALCQFVIDFTYDTIEKSRRRMLLEAVQLARRCEDDTAIRQSLMDYLQEGMDAKRVTELAEQEEIDFREWIDLIDDVSDPAEASELRGISIRLLEAYPDHAGLLSLRALTEALATGGSETMIRDSLRLAFSSAIEKHLCSDEDVNDLIVSLLELSTSELPHIRTALLDLLNLTEEQSFVPQASVYEHLASASQSWGEEERAVALQVITIHSVSVVVPGLKSRLDERSSINMDLRK